MKTIFNHLPEPTEKTKKTSVDILPSIHEKTMKELSKRNRTFQQLVEAAERQFLAECEKEKNRDKAN